MRTPSFKAVAPGGVATGTSEERGGGGGGPRALSHLEGENVTKEPRLASAPRRNVETHSGGRRHPEPPNNVQKGSCSMTVTRKVTRIARHVKRRDAVSDDRQRGWFAATGSIRARCQHSQLEPGKRRFST